MKKDTFKDSMKKMDVEKMTNFRILVRKLKTYAKELGYKGKIQIFKDPILQEGKDGRLHF